MLSTLISTLIKSIFILWQSGISSWVFFDAIIPAIRAVENISPFSTLSFLISSKVFFETFTLPDAIATLLLAFLSDISTIFASPELFM